MANIKKRGGIGIQTKGLKEFSKMLEKIPDRVEKKIVKRSLKKASKPMIKEARRNAPRDSGELKKSIGSVMLPNRKTPPKVFMVFIGPRIKGKREGGYYSHILELGTVKQKPQPYMKPAFRSTQTVVLNTFVNELAPRFVDEVEKFLK